MAIMVQIGRGKDRARLEELLKHEGLFNRSKLEEILLRFDLKSKWEQTLQWIKKT